MKYNEVLDKLTISIVVKSVEKSGDSFKNICFCFVLKLVNNQLFFGPQIGCLNKNINGVTKQVSKFYYSDSYDTPGIYNVQ